ncbi:MAG: ABC transporter ATP-binding protein [Methanobrevibacter sp.]|jgi:molybdate/tungstate transport system ATP-binding protein|nr:ABC transporter ATP-binding protein [Candidatus Methanovirga australis]
MIRIESLKKDWGEFKINNINLEINDNEYFVILGPSGSGKTMLLELIAGVYHPDSGKIYLNEKDITYMELEKRGVGVVYQDYMLFPHKTVFENISFGLEMRKTPKKRVESMVEDIMGMLGISHLKNRYPRTLSGGEKQRTSIARAIIVKPKLLLLDEPLSALDQEIREDLIKNIKEIHVKFQITMIHVTHNFDEALILSDRIAIMKKGTIAQVGDSVEIFRHPSTKFVAEFVGVENIFKGTAKKVDDGLTVVDTGNISIYSTQEREGSVHLTLRPEDISVSLDKVQTSAKNVFKGGIKEIIDKGAIIKLMIDIKEPLIVFLTRQSFLEMGLNIGKEVWIYFKATAVNTF